MWPCCALAVRWTSISLNSVPTSPPLPLVLHQFWPLCHRSTMYPLFQLFMHLLHSAFQLPFLCVLYSFPLAFSFLSSNTHHQHHHHPCVSFHLVLCPSYSLSLSTSPFAKRCWCCCIAHTIIPKGICPNWSLPRITAFHLFRPLDLSSIQCPSKLLFKDINLISNSNFCKSWNEKNVFFFFFFTKPK